MAKIRIKEIESHLEAIHQIIADCRADMAAERGESGASDNPPPTSGTPRAPDAMDSAADPWQRGQFAVRPKGLTHIPNTAATRALRNIPGYTRLSK